MSVGLNRPDWAENIDVMYSVGLGSIIRPTVISLDVFLSQKFIAWATISVRIDRINYADYPPIILFH